MRSLLQIITLIVLCCGFRAIGLGAWERVYIGTFASLRSIYFLDGQKGWIVGTRGAFLTSADGGKSWKLEKSFTQDDLLDVHFTDAQNGWLLCERDVYSSGTNSVSYLRRTSDGGKTWQTVELQSGRDRLVRLAFSKDGFGYAFGEGGGVWQMLDDRVSWKRSELPVRYLMRAGWFADPFNGVLVGGSGTALVTSDGGAEWILGTGDKPIQSKLNDVFFIDAKRGWAVGGNGTILSTLNGGKLWRVLPSAVSEDLFGLCFTNSGFGIAVGDRGRILESSPPGSDWAPARSGVEAKLEDVTTVGNIGIAVGFGGTVLVRK